MIGNLKNFKIVFILLIIGSSAVLIGCNGTDSPIELSGDLLSDLNTLLDRKGVSFHNTLRDIQAVAVKYRTLKEVSELEDYLKKQGIIVVKTKDEIECVVAKDAFTCPLGFKYDLSLTFYKSFYPLGFARAGFQTSRGIPYSGFLDKKTFTVDQKKKLIDPVISKVFLHPLISQASSKYPIVKELKVEYGLLFDRRSDFSPHAFHVYVEFRGNPQKPKAFKSFFLSIISALDYPLREDGTAVTNVYSIADKLDNVTMHSSREDY